MIEIIKILEESHFPVIDFKFQNRGRGTALLHQFSLHIAEINVDPTPVLRAFLTIQEDESRVTRVRMSDEVQGPLAIAIRNDGWGPASDLKIQLRPPLSNLFPTASNVFLPSLDSGEIAKQVLLLSPAGLNLAGFRDALRAQEAQRTNPTGGFFARSAPAPPNELELELPKIKIDFSDTEHQSATAELKCSDDWLPGNAWGALFVSETNFRWSGNWVMASASMPSAVYYVSLDTEGESNHRTYSISHKIPPGDIEHFSIMLGSDKSCRARLRFEFMVDSDRSVRSQDFTVKIWNPMNEQHYEYRNGDELIRKQLISTSGLTSLSPTRFDSWERREFADSEFPFIRHSSEENTRFWKRFLP